MSIEDPISPADHGAFRDPVPARDRLPNHAPPANPAMQLKPDGPTWCHKKTGGFYTVLHACLNEADLKPMVVYRDNVKGTIWVRPVSEFLDGRFAPAGS
jgi:hypothetical protein